MHIYTCKVLTERLAGVIAERDVIKTTSDATSGKAKDQSKRLVTVQLRLSIVPTEQDQRSLKLAIIERIFLQLAENSLNMLALVYK